MIHGFVIVEDEGKKAMLLFEKKEMFFWCCVFGV